MVIWWQLLSLALSVAPSPIQSFSVDVWKCADFPFLVLTHIYIQRDKWIDMYVCKCTTLFTNGFDGAGTRALYKDQNDQPLNSYCAFAIGLLDGNMSLNASI